MDKYTIRHPYKDSKYNEIEITSDNLLYSEIGNGRGCQVMNLNNELLILKKCEDIANLIREIEILNKVDN